VCQKLINNTTNLFFETAVSILVISNHNSFRVLFEKLLPYTFFEKYIYILALKTASPGNQHCANCIGTLSFSLEYRRWCHRFVGWIISTDTSSCKRADKS